MATIEISAQVIKELREKTGAGVMECKTALTKSNGDMQKAEEIIKERSVVSAAKKSGRATKEGIIETYIHTGNKIGVMLELNCETDFVAKTEDFRNLARELAMQVAALAPRYLSRDIVPQEKVDEYKKEYFEQAKAEGKKEAVIDKIVEGKLSKYYEVICLLDQPYIRDDSKKIHEIIKEVVGKTGENITLGRFVRYQVGE